MQILKVPTVKHTNSNELNSMQEIMNSVKLRNKKTLLDFSFDSPILIVFFRHFGCTFCREAASDISKVREEIEAQGTQLVFVHLGTDQQGIEFFSKYNLQDVHLISDPKMKMYCAFDLKKGGVSQLFGFKVWMRGFVAGILEGHGIGRLMGNGFQLPGVFLVRDGSLVRTFRHETASDRPNYKTLSCCEI